MEKKIGEPPDLVESVAHIQSYCPVLQLPRIAIHHGTWRELLSSIRKSSTELNDISEPRWHFPSALRVDLNPLKKKFTRSYVRNVRIDFPTLFLNWHQKPVRFIFRTCFGLVISVRAH